MSRAAVARLPAGRLHLSDGPIDLVVATHGTAAAVAAAEAAAIARFAQVLDELCTELPLLRRATAARPRGPIARRMWQATAPHAADAFITPMAAVAGAVAEDIRDVMLTAAPLDRLIVNNGGDIALHLDAGQTLRVGLVDRPDRPSLFARAMLAASDGVRGIATSGWRGRSFSLGIADAVTVLAADAAAADAAATMIANAVDLPGDPAVIRRPARDLAPDSDLGDRPVTVAVGPLAAADIDHALDGGIAVARHCLDRRLIVAAALHCAGVTRTVIAPEREFLAHA